MCNMNMHYTFIPILSPESVLASPHSGGADPHVHVSLLSQPPLGTYGLFIIFSYCLNFQVLSVH
jgi:hypothetical protein